MGAARAALHRGSDDALRALKKLSEGTTGADAPLPKVSLRDTVGTLFDVIVPSLAKGVIIRRPLAVALAERLDLDSRAVRRMQLRANANWAFLKPRQHGLQQRFFERLNHHLAQAAPGSLAAVVAATP